MEELWNDLNQALAPEIACSIGDVEQWFHFKNISTKNIALGGTIMEMEKYNNSIFLALTTYWTPLYDAYCKIAETYDIEFVLKSIEPGCGVFRNTDATGEFFPEEYCVTCVDDSIVTPSGKKLYEQLEPEACFESEQETLDKFREIGYPAKNYKILKTLVEKDDIWIHQFEDPYH